MQGDSIFVERFSCWVVLAIELLLSPLRVPIAWSTVPVTVIGTGLE